MSRRALFGFVAAVVVAGAASTSCKAEADTCAQLERDLSRCGIPTESLECSRVDRSDQESLVALVEERGCAGLATENDHVVDARVCKLGGFTCPDSPIPAPGPTVARHPIVLVSGIDGSPAFDWNPRIVEALRGDGLDVRIVHVLPWATTEARAADLFASLEALAATADIEKVNLVCYAVGGLDCRYLVSPGGLFAYDEAQRKKARGLVASITTIATPHRGTQVADATLSAVRSGEATALLHALAGDADESQTSAFATGTLEKTLDGLTPRALASFNQTVVDDDDVVMQSFAGVSSILAVGTSDGAAEAHCRDEAGELVFFKHPGTRDATNPLLWITTPFAKTTLDDRGGTVTSPADGMVSIESAKWGRFRGCVPADHYDVIGQVNRVARDPQTGFDPVDFYRWLAADLGEQGL